MQGGTNRFFTRRRLLKALAGLFVSVSGTGAYGAYIEPRSGPRVTRYALTPKNWPQGLKLRVAALSDLHCGSRHVSLDHLRMIVAAANGLEADLILLLGDYVTNARSNVHRVQPDEWARELARLTAPLGRFAILGNHEYWDDPARRIRKAGMTAGGLALDRAGIPLLRNGVVRLEKAGQTFWLAGLDDQIAFPAGNGNFVGLDDLEGTLRQVTDDRPVILMAHEPDIFVDVPSRVALTLSGHTHGGQVRIFGWSPYIPSQYGDRFAYGHIVEQERDLIVSCGLGTSGPPFRIGMPPEIVQVDLG